MLLLETCDLLINIFEQLLTSSHQSDAVLSSFLLLHYGIHCLCVFACLTLHPPFLLSSRLTFFLHRFSSLIWLVLWFMARHRFWFVLLTFFVSLLGMHRCLVSEPASTTSSDDETVETLILIDWLIVHCLYSINKNMLTVDKLQTVTTVMDRIYF